VGSIDSVVAGCVGSAFLPPAAGVVNPKTDISVRFWFGLVQFSVFGEKMSTPIGVHGGGVSDDGWADMLLS
jgi:hypothetical protein